MGRDPLAPRERLTQRVRPAASRRDSAPPRFLLPPPSVTLTWDHQGLQPLAQTERLVAADGGEVDRRFFAIVTDLIGTPLELVDESGGDRLAHPCDGVGGDHVEHRRARLHAVWAWVRRPTLVRTSRTR